MKRNSIFMLALMLCGTAFGQIRLVSDADDARYRSLLPVTNVEAYNNLFADPNLVFYTRQEVPQAVQVWGGIVNHALGIFSVDHDLSIGGDQKKRRTIPALGPDGRGFGNGGAEHPWGQPFGTELAVNSSKVGFVRFSGPMVWTLKQLPGDPTANDTRDRLPTIVWYYKNGTTFGEILSQRGPDGRDYAYDVRLRTRTATEWKPDLLRPFTSADKMFAFIKERRPGVRDTRQPSVVVDFADNHPVKALSVRTLVDKLPPIGDDQLVVEMLTGVKWESQVGVDWEVDDNGISCIGPTRDGTDQSFGIVPPGFTGGLPKVSTKDCMACHRDTLTHVRHFDLNRDWYGRVPGSDGIFSLHPFRADAIARSNERRNKVVFMERILLAHQRGDAQMKEAAFNDLERTIMNPKLLQAGLLERFDPAKHSPADYNTLVKPKL